MVKYKNGKVEIEEGEAVITPDHPASKDIEVYYEGKKLKATCVVIKW